MFRRSLFLLVALASVSCTPRTRGTAAAAPTPTGAATGAPTTAPPAAPTTTAKTEAKPAERPLMPPLSTADMRRDEVRMVLAELTAALTGTNLDRVKNIPLVFDPDQSEINAFAGCQKGAPYMAVTEGFMIAIDAVANTRATDEVFGTKTYDAYTNGLPKRLSQKGAIPSMLPGTIPAQYEADPKRGSRARELYQDLVAFALGHELAHHYLGHTGCANGQPQTGGPTPAQLGSLVTEVIPILNQPIELAADSAGTRNVLSAGRARRPRFEWTEAGGLSLFDFFGRLEADAPMVAKIAFLRTHPDSKVRIPFVQGAAQQWHKDNP